MLLPYYLQRKWVCNVISDTLAFQKLPYRFVAVPSIRDWLTSHVALDEKTLFDMSLRREPRGAARSEIV